MRVTLTAKDLIDFENEIAALFEAGEIRAPVHLAGGNEEQLIRIFREHVNEQDWVLGGWRMHFHCLLKGVPSKELKAAILAGRSISLCFPRYRILSSGIVGGVAPIAVGLAMGIKRKEDEKNRKVICFLGDMAYESGIVHESVKYAGRHGLPVQWIIEDNGLSVGTPTRTVWGWPELAPYTATRYEYKLTRPHVGTGKWVSF